MLKIVVTHDVDDDKDDDDDDDDGNDLQDESEMYLGIFLQL